MNVRKRVWTRLLPWKKFQHVHISHGRQPGVSSPQTSEYRLSCRFKAVANSSPSWAGLFWFSPADKYSHFLNCSLRSINKNTLDKWMTSSPSPEFQLPGWSLSSNLLPSPADWTHYLMKPLLVVCLSNYLYSWKKVISQNANYPFFSKIKGPC